MMFNAFWAHEFETRAFRAEIGYWLVLVLVAGDVVRKVGLHVLDGKGPMVHGSYEEFIYCESPETIQR